MKRRKPAQQSHHVLTSAANQGPKDSWQALVVVLVALAGFGWYLFAESSIAGRWGFSLDDSWIYATYAKNLATGHGYSFNPGEHVAGATGPLYVFVLAGLYALFGDVVVPAKILGIVCHIAASLVLMVAMRALLPRSRWAPLFAGVLLASSPPLLWGALGGLEIPVYTLLLCAGIYFYAREQSILTTFCWSLGVWLRPEGAILALLGVVGRTGLSPRKVLWPAAVAVLLVGTYGLFNIAVGGWFLPNSVRVASHLGGNPLSSEWTMVKEWADLWLGSIGRWHPALHPVLLLPLIVVGSILVARRLPALPAFFVLLPGALALFRAWGGQLDRYLMPTIPFGIVLAAIGLDYASRRIGDSKAAMSVLTIGLVCFGWQAIMARRVGVAHGWNVQNINGMQRFIAEATKRATSPGDTVAVNDVGAMGYFSDCYVLDLVGLTSPRRGFPQAMAQFKPKYLVIFPDWFQRFGAVDPKTDQVVFYDADSTYKWSPFLAVRLRRNTISSRHTILLYERMGRNETGTMHPQLIVH